MTCTISFALLVGVFVACISCSNAFSITSNGVGIRKLPTCDSSRIKPLLKMSDFQQETPAQSKARIQELVDQHPVLLFMKGSKIFPQCGFSNTATQILQTFNIDFHTVDVLADESIRSGVKDFSQWPTIPQLYVAGEFIGGSDIMIEMYQNGELGEMIEKAKADMM